MKHIVTGGAVLALAIGLVGCSGNNITAPDRLTGGASSASTTAGSAGSSVFSTRDATTTSGITTNDNNFSSSLDGDFVGFAAAANEAMIELSMLAANSGDADEVKDFAAELVQDYRSALNQLRAAASGSDNGSGANASNLSSGDAGGSSNVPEHVSMDATHQGLFSQLSSTSGSAFDRAYMTIVIQDLQTAMNRYQQGASGSSSLQSYSSGWMLHLQQQYQRARDIARRVGSPLSSIQTVR